MMATTNWKEMVVAMTAAPIPGTLTATGTAPVGAPLAAEHVTVERSAAPSAAATDPHG